jgi:MFS family permease
LALQIAQYGSEPASTCTAVTSTAWLVGLTLGVRNLSQQGMFLVGGSLADRLGYKPMIVAGLILRTAGLALLGLVDSVPALLVASTATGLAGALFNPAVRAYVANDAGQRRVEASRCSTSSIRPEFSLVR